MDDQQQTVKATQNDTLVLLVLIIRKIQNLNSKQLVKLSNEIYDICKETDGIFVLQSVLFQGISSLNPKCAILAKIMALFPSKNYEEHKSESLTLLTIPFDLRTKALDYLSISEMYQIQKVCHCLNVNGSVIIDLSEIILYEDDEYNNWDVLTSLSRKLNQCNKSELIKSMKNIINIINGNDCSLRCVLLNGLTTYYKKMGAKILNKILNILPDEKIGDSLRYYDDDEMEEGSMTLLTIPTDLRIYILHVYKRIRWYKFNLSLFVC
eukprot:464534_1